MSKSFIAYTTDPEDSDVRRMVVSPGLSDQPNARIYEDALGRPCLQRSDVYGLCYATSTSKIYNMCKAEQVDRNGAKLFCGDRCFTITKYFERPKAEIAIGISRSQDLHECELEDGRLI